MLKKYVIIKGEPVLFSSKIKHADVVDKRDNVDSAGFCVIYITNDDAKVKVLCTGESSTLNIGSRPKTDELIIAEFLRSKS